MLHTKLSFLGVVLCNWPSCVDCLRISRYPRNARRKIAGYFSIPGHLRGATMPHQSGASAADAATARRDNVMNSRCRTESSNSYSSMISL
jgi:hypothetical protein